MEQRETQGMEQDEGDGRVTCSHVILSTWLAICEVVSPPSLPAGFLVEGPDIPIALVVASSDCSEVFTAVYLGGVIGGCYGLPGGTNHLYSIEIDPMPGECFYITFFR